MMKRIMLLLCVCALVFLCACGAAETAPAVDQTAEEAAPAAVTAENQPDGAAQEAPAEDASAAEAEAAEIEADEVEATPDPNADEKQQKQVFAMDTAMILTAYGSNAAEALDAAEQEIYRIEADMDPESVTGSVYALNAGAGSPVKISDDCMSIMQTALFYWKDTGGKLDPALYPVIKAWGFTTDNYRVPTQAELDELLAAKKTDEIVVDPEAGTATVPAGSQVSFGAVAKGYTAQRVVDLLSDYGVTSAILSLGGNVQTLGETRPDGSAWRVAIVDPADTGSYVGIMHLGQKTAVTSGGYQRYFEQDGVTYIHIIDPATGRPVDNDLLSMTVVTDDGTNADALSTSLFVMGKDAALDYYYANDYFELVIITTDNEVIVTPGLVDVFEEKSDNYTYTYLTE